MRLKRVLAVTILAISIVILGVGNANVAATAPNTQIINLQITTVSNSGYSNYYESITGTIQYDDSGTWASLSEVPICLSYSGNPQPCFDTVQSFSDGSFNYNWYPTLNAGPYTLTATYGGNGNGTLRSSTASKQFQVNLQLELALSSNIVYIPPGSNNVVTVTTTVMNDVVQSHTIALGPVGGICQLSGISVPCTFTPESGTAISGTPFVSQLAISVPITQGSYEGVIHITAQSQDNFQATATATLTVVVQTPQSYPNTPTQITGLSASYYPVAQSVWVTGTLQYQNPAGDLNPLYGAQVSFSWVLLTGGGGGSMGSAVTGSDGSFSLTYAESFQPGTYTINAAFSDGTYSISDSKYQYTFLSCSSSYSLQVLLQLKPLTINPTSVTTVPDGSTSVSVTVTDGLSNDQGTHTIALSLTDPSNVLVQSSFNPSSGTVSGSASLTSTLKLHVSNSTQPGTYKITITAIAQDSNSITVTAQVTIIVQNNTHGLSLVVQGLPSDVQTTLQIGNRAPEQVGSGTYSYIISNSTQTISVTQQINSASGDTQYRCQVFSQSISNSVASITFTYTTWYQFKVTGGGLPATLTSKSPVTLVLKANGTDNSQNNFNPVQGLISFYPQNTIIDFEITPSYIHSADLDYNFTGWENPATGQANNLPTSAGGLYEISLTKPYSVEASYSEWVEVTIESNLPINMSTLIQISDANGAMRTVSVVGSVPYPAGLLPVGSTFQYEVNQTQLLFFSNDGNTRYEFQGVTPPSPMTLNKHTTITMNYVTKYKVLVVSQFPNTILQPTNGIGWFYSGDNVTLQAKASANDKNGVPYLFDGWNGLPQSSNQTTVNLIVNGPLQVSVQWKPNWTYLLIFAGVASGISVPAFLIGRRKLGAWKQNRLAKKKPVPDTGDQPDGMPKGLPKTGADKDIEVYNYIIEKGGSIRIPDAMKELDMSREEVNESIRRLKETKLLH